jgi:hypothetical protein
MNRALLIGINKYPDAPLRGCVNDVQDMASFLVTRAGFKHSEVRLLVDKRATTTAILERLSWLVNGVREGDRLLFHYSGHGAQLPTRSPSGEVDKLDEVICPVDFDFTDEHAIRDKMFARIFSKVPAGVSFVWVSDSCHSGDLTKDLRRKPRAMPLPIDIAWRLETAKRNDRKPLSFVHAINGYNVALISGCRSDQTSADADFNDRANGAMTRALLDELSERGAMDRPLPKLVDGLRKRLKQMDYEQEPQLEGSARIMERGFLGSARGGSCSTVQEHVRRRPGVN